LRDGCAGSVRFYAAALLFCLSNLALRADEFESSGVEAGAEFTPSLSEEGAEPALPQPLPPPWSGDFWTRSQLTGDWAGSRDELAENGLTFFGDITQYYQGVTAGGLARQFEYGGRGDYLIDVDSRKMGLWEGGHLDFRGETRLGQDCNRIDGAVAPSNFAMILPLPGQNVTALTGLQYTQDLSENLTVFFGKLNLLDGTPASYARGMRLNYFLNAAMQNNLSRIFLLPSVLGGGLVVRDEVEPVFNFYLLDTHFTPTTSGF
jgi:porin